MCHFFFHPRGFLCSALAYFFFGARLPKNIKISTCEKALKSSHFRPEYRRQISLDLSHACKYRMRLISSIILQNFYAAVLQACCEYSEHVFLLI
jgi:hypothetical protein